MKYDLTIEKSAQKYLAKITEPFQSKIIDKIYALANDPHYNAIKLTGRDAYRIRVGNYRVIYEINNDELIILVVSIGHRKNVYNR